MTEASGAEVTSTGVADVFEQTNQDLTENRRELAEQSAKINGNADLSDVAKQRYIDEATGAAQKEYVRLMDEHERALSERLETNEKRLFALSYGQDAVTETQRESFRSSYRQATLGLLGASEETVSRALSRAHRVGDRALEQAAYHEAIERGLSEVGDEYRARHPEAVQHWNTYVADRRAAESRETILAGAMMKSAGQV